MADRLRARAMAKLVLAAAFLVTAIVTVFYAEWFEALTGLEPDGGSGAFEWLIVAVLGVASLAVGAWGYNDVRRLRIAEAEA